MGHPGSAALCQDPPAQPQQHPAACQAPTRLTAATQQRRRVAGLAEIACADSGADQPRLVLPVNVSTHRKEMRAATAD